MNILNMFMLQCILCTSNHKFFRIYGTLQIIFKNYFCRRGDPPRHGGREDCGGVPSGGSGPGELRLTGDEDLPRPMDGQVRLRLPLVRTLSSQPTGRPQI